MKAYTTEPYARKENRRIFYKSHRQARRNAGNTAGPGAARQAFKAEARTAQRWEAPIVLSTHKIFVTPAFTCPRGCKCGGYCPAAEARS